MFPLSSSHRFYLVMALLSLGAVGLLGCGIAACCDSGSGTAEGIPTPISSLPSYDIGDPSFPQLRCKLPVEPEVVFAPDGVAGNFIALGHRDGVVYTLTGERFESELPPFETAKAALAEESLFQRRTLWQQPTQILDQPALDMLQECSRGAKVYYQRIRFVSGSNRLYALIVSGRMDDVTSKQVDAVFDSLFVFDYGTETRNMDVVKISR